MKFILGQKKSMTQIFNEQTGDVIPVTRVSAGPCPIIRLKKASDKDGYNAVVVGLPGKKKLGKRDLGQTRGLGNLQYIKEFRTDELENLTVGQLIKVDTFQLGDKVKVVGTSKGKGFQGVIKRHGFHGQHATHGTKDQERAPGSIGATEPARVFPGMKMPGHMGAQQVTVKNLEIVKIDLDNNELYIKGAVPGAKGSLLMISCPGELKVVSTDQTSQSTEIDDKDDQMQKEKAETTAEQTEPASAESTDDSPVSSTDAQAVTASSSDKPAEASATDQSTADEAGNQESRDKDN